MIDSDALRETLANAAQDLWQQLSNLAERWTVPVVERLNRRGSIGYPKTFNDPIWGVIELFPWETAILDSPLLQRLRGVRQLGMAHLVYPGATHDRLEHSRGVVEVAERMITALERNAERRRRFGKDRDEAIPNVTDLDRVSIRLAALLHDIGHGPFSHATEPSLYQRMQRDFDAAEEVLRTTYDGVTKVSPGEIIAVCMVMSQAMKEVFAHEKFGADVTPAELPATIGARIVGSRSCLSAGYLSGIISGPIDADKLDYMSRDCHHSGLPVGQDVTRLISKLEVVIVTPDNAPSPELRERAQGSSSKRFYETGLSLAGLGAYEQMIIGRVILYDRLYYHHKVRSAEAMVRAIFSVGEEERGQPYKLDELFAEHGDDTLLSLIGGLFGSTSQLAGDSRTNELAEAIACRNIYYRCFAFAARFIDGLSGLSLPEQDDTRTLAWRKLLRALRSEEQRAELAEAIHDLALKLSNVIEMDASDLRPEHVLVDLPLNKTAVRGGDILTRTDDGQIGTPNLFFDPERWSKAYEHQKQCGFVFTPRSYVPVVSLASRIVFYERFGVVMSKAADRASKTTGMVRPAWIEKARDAQLCSIECYTVLTSTKPSLVKFHPDDFDLPEHWTSEDPGLADRLTTDSNKALPFGLPSVFHKAVTELVPKICTFLDLVEKGGTFDGTNMSERVLQDALRNHLRSCQVMVREGEEVGGGESDLIVSGSIVIENKVRGATSDPLSVGPHYSWQERRYSIAVCSRVGVVVLAYQPTDETAILPLPLRIAVHSTPNSPEEHRLQIRVVVPYGREKPSTAKAPRKPKKR